MFLFEGLVTGQCVHTDANDFSPSFDECRVFVTKTKSFGGTPGGIIYWIESTTAYRPEFRTSVRETDSPAVEISSNEGAV